MSSVYGSSTVPSSAAHADLSQHTNTQYNHSLSIMQTLDERFAFQVGRYFAGDTYYGSRTSPSDDIDPRTPMLGQIGDSELRGFAEAAYKPPAKLGDYSRVPALSSGETSVYVDPRTATAVITLRGSNKIGDVGTDALLAVGQLSNTARYKRTVKEVQRAHDALKGYKISVTGHSLGGSLANEITARNPHVRGVGFNSGYALPGVSQTRGSGTRDYAEYLNSNDIISSGSFFRKQQKTMRRYRNNRYALGAHKARPTAKSYRTASFSNY